MLDLLSFVRTVATATVAAVSAIKMVFFGKNQKPIFKIKIFALDQLWQLLVRGIIGFFRIIVHAGILLREAQDS